MFDGLVGYFVGSRDNSIVDGSAEPDELPSSEATVEGSLDGREWGDLTNLATPYLAVITAVCLGVITYACHRFNSYAHPPVDEPEGGDVDAEAPASTSSGSTDGEEVAARRESAASSSGSGSASEAEGADEEKAKSAESSSGSDVAAGASGAGEEAIAEPIHGPEEPAMPVLEALAIVQKATMEAVAGRVEQCRREMTEKHASFSEVSEKLSQARIARGSLIKRIDVKGRSKTGNEFQELERLQEKEKRLRLEIEEARSAVAEARSVAASAARSAPERRRSSSKALKAEEKSVSRAFTKLSTLNGSLSEVQGKINNLEQRIADKEQLKKLKKRCDRLARKLFKARNADAKAVKKFEKAEDYAENVRRSMAVQSSVLSADGGELSDLPKVSLRGLNIVAIPEEIGQITLSNVIKGKDGAPPLAATMLKVLLVIAKNALGRPARPDTSDLSAKRRASRWFGGFKGMEHLSGSIFEESDEAADKRRVEAINAILRMSWEYHDLSTPLFVQMTAGLKNLVGSIPRLWWLDETDREPRLKKTPRPDDYSPPPSFSRNPTEERALRLSYFEGLAASIQNLFLSADPEDESAPKGIDEEVSTLETLLSLVEVFDIPSFSTDRRAVKFFQGIKEDTKKWIEATGASDRGAGNSIELGKLSGSDHSDAGVVRILNTLKCHKPGFAFVVKKLLKTLLLEPIDECKAYFLESGGASSGSKRDPREDMERPYLLGMNASKFIDVREAIAKLSGRLHVDVVGKGVMKVFMTPARMNTPDGREKIIESIAKSLAKSPEDNVGAEVVDNMEKTEFIQKLLSDQLNLAYRFIQQLYASFLTNGVIDIDQQPSIPFLEHVWNITALMEILVRKGKSVKNIFQDERSPDESMVDGLFNISSESAGKEKPDPKLLSDFERNFDPYDAASWDKIKAALTIEFLKAADCLFEYLTEVAKTKVAKGGEKAQNAFEPILGAIPYAIEVAKYISELVSQPQASSSSASSPPSELASEAEGS
ncbi:MAG: hypothetical protein KR126chlam1_00033 [Chlamydiae bacterium]|nr:hypothetical protein [Chlamydiota bacterium]